MIYTYSIMFTYVLAVLILKVEIWYINAIFLFTSEQQVSPFGLKSAFVIINKDKHMLHAQYTDAWYIDKKTFQEFFFEIDIS